MDPVREAENISVLAEGQLRASLPELFSHCALAGIEFYDVYGAAPHELARLGIDGRRYADRRRWHNLDLKRDSERMRAQLWDMASAEFRRIKGEVNAALRANSSSIEAIAQRLVDAPDLTVSGPILTALLGELDLVPTIAAMDSPKGGQTGSPQ